MTTTTSASLIVGAASSARCGGPTAGALQRHALDAVGTRFAETLDAVGWMSSGSSAASSAMLHDATRDNTLADPAFRYLLSALRRTADNPDLLLELLGTGLTDFAWPAQLAAGARSAWRSRLDDAGGLRAGGTPCFVEFGPAYAHADVHLAVADHRMTATIASDGLTVEVLHEDLASVGSALDGSEVATIADHGFAISPVSYTGNGIPISGRDPWLRPRLTGTNQRSDGTTFFEATWDHYAVDPQFAGLERAWHLVGSVWPEALDEIAVFVRRIVPLQTGPDAHLAFTVGSRQGAIFLGQAPPLDLAEMVLHEAAHVKLRQMQLLDSLLVDPLDEQRRVSVPWRPDPRPIPGVLEGLFVFSHIAELHCRLIAARAFDVEAVAHLVEVTRDRLEHLRFAQRELSTSELTPCGHEVVAALGRWIAELGDHV